MIDDDDGDRHDDDGDDDDDDGETGEGEWQLSSASMTNFPRQLTAQFPPHDFTLMHVDI